MAKIKIHKDGPYEIEGKLPLDQLIIVKDKEGYSVKYKKGKKLSEKENYELCRCGKSKNKPFCDGTHHKIKFKGTETASRDKFVKQAAKIVGSNLILYDVESYCFGAGFCHSKGGTVWESTRNSNQKSSRALAVKEACLCPSGRLVACDKKTKKPIELKFTPSISILEEPDKGVSGPIWVKGGIEIISADGKKYEIRNRVTLCRCGKSSNKPFCDGTHVEIRFKDNK